MPGSAVCGPFPQSGGSQAALAERWRAGIWALVLSKKGSGGTGIGEEAAELLAVHKWAESTWKTRFSQIFRWLCFCEEKQRDLLPPEEGDVVAFVGFLSVKGQVGLKSAKQYVPAVAQYHLDLEFP